MKGYVLIYASKAMVSTSVFVGEPDVEFRVAEVTSDATGGACGMASTALGTHVDEGAQGTEAACRDARRQALASACHGDEGAQGTEAACHRGHGTEGPPRPHTHVSSSHREGTVGTLSGPDRTASGSTSTTYLQRLGEQIIDLTHRIATLDYRRLVLIEQFDRLEGWKTEGFDSCAEWLAVRAGIQRATAAEKVRTARALKHLPQTSAAMQQGTISYSNTRAITRVATPQNEAQLLAHARANSTEGLERIVRLWKHKSEAEALSEEEVRHARRHCSVWVDEGGMYTVRATLEPESGALLKRAVEAATDVLFRAMPEGERADVSRGSLQADALALLAERALSAGFDGEGGARRHGTRAERYQVMLHVDVDTLRKEAPLGESPALVRSCESASARVEGKVPRRAGTSARSTLDEVRVCAETSRRLTCDASVVQVEEDRSGSVLNVGRKRRTVPSSIRRALQVRDGTCRYPGCVCSFTEAHHVRHWAEGGETRLGNLLLLCRRHHRAVHEGGIRIQGEVTGTVAFLTKEGRLIGRSPAVSAESRAGIHESTPPVGRAQAHSQTGFQLKAEKWDR